MPPATSADPLEALSLASTHASRTALLHRHPILRTPSTVQSLCVLAVRLLHVDLERAQTAAESAHWLSAQLDDSRSIAFSTRAVGNVHLLRGHVSEAIACYESACNVFRGLDDLEQVANTHLNQISALLQVGDTATALTLAARARELFASLGHDLGLARLENNLGILYHRQDDNEQARVHWQAAYERFLALHKSHDAAIALRNLAVAAITTNSYHEALALYRRAREYCESQGLAVLIHEIDYNIAYLYFLRGNYEQALDGYRQARSRSQERGDLYHAALCDLDETELYLELNLLQDASDLADRAIASFRQLKSRQETAKALAFRGIAASRLGDPRVAITYLRRSRGEFEAEGNLPWASLIHLYEALVFQHEGRLFEAARAAQSALRGFEKIGAEVRIALCHLVLSQLELAKSNHTEARNACDRASRLLEESGLPPLLFQSLFTLGEIHESSGDFERAQQAYSSAERLLGAIRSRVSTEELRLPLTTHRLEVYERLLTLGPYSQRGSSFEEAFLLVEKAKARSLSDLLSSRATPVATSTPARSSLVEQVRSLREELNWYYKRYAQTDYSATPPSEESLHTLQASLVQTERELAGSLAKISQADLELGSLHQALSVDFHEVRSLLRDDELVLEYFVGRDVVFLLAFSKSTSTCEPIAVPSEINEVRRLIEFQFSRLFASPARELGRRSSEKTFGYLKRLYSLLIEPFKDDIKSFSRITVVPHSFLFYLPFACLLGGDSLLEEEASVVLSPSASSLYFSRQWKEAPSDGALAFSDSLAGGQSPLRRHKRWKTEWVSANAPSKQWRELLERQWALIHLPLGASFRQDNPVLSSIRVCRERLTILDLFSLPLRASVLVATGCAHLPGRSGSGDEYVALSRGLLYSGPQTLVLPLWQPRAAAERLFLDSFYESLASGADGPMSVCSARRATRECFPHPGDWAAWASFGV